MRPLWDLVEEAISTAFAHNQDTFDDAEENELEKLVSWLENNVIRTANHLD